MRSDQNGNEFCKRMVSCRDTVWRRFGIYPGKDTKVKVSVPPPEGARVLLMDGTSVESAFALLLTKVTKPPYPTNISFYTIAGKDTNLCAMSGTGFRKRGEEYNDETNNQWYDRDRVSGS